MDDSKALAALSALSQATRLDAFRMLVAHEPKGVAAGEIARALCVPQNTLSAHLAVLTQAGLATSERHSRSIIYRADLSHLRALVLFLLKDCCGGRPDVCSPILADISPCSPRKA
ncbi:MAG: helix-turn-helix transcriptional regulator [Hyphomicrobiales bacterium]|nr:helix-turn-helix transcriptional regulator [Hyphomicrobiales bacterium]